VSASDNFNRGGEVTHSPDASEWTTRRAPHMERYVVIQPVVMEGSPEARNVFLQVGNQRFCVSQNGCENLEEAEWLRDMICIALEKVVRDNSILGNEKR